MRTAPGQVENSKSLEGKKRTVIPRRKNPEIERGKYTQRAQETIAGHKTVQ